MASTKKPNRHGKTPIGGVYLGGIFGDGGGVIIYPGHDGKLHLKRIPPMGPAVIGAIELFMVAENAEAGAVRSKLVGIATRLLNEHGEQIREAIGAIASER